MGANMTFDIDKFREQHNHDGKLNSVSDATIEFWFEAAEMLLGGDDCIIKNEKEKELAITLLTCHIGAQQISQSVGTTSSASEGSVSVSTAIPASLQKSWITTTPCGVLLWALLAKYRMGMRWFNMPVRRGFR